MCDCFEAADVREGNLRNFIKRKNILHNINSNVFKQLKTLSVFINEIELREKRNHVFNVAYVNENDGERLISFNVLNVATVADFIPYCIRSH